MNASGNEPDPPAGSDWRSYRCPVCGHADEVAVPEKGRLRIRCSHCDTPLAVERESEGAERVSVHVAEEDDGG